MRLQSDCTGILVQAEASTAEIDPPLFPHALLHQTVEDKDEKSYKMNTWMSLEEQNGLSSICWPALLFG